MVASPVGMLFVKLYAFLEIENGIITFLYWILGISCCVTVLSLMFYKFQSYIDNKK